ncbi:hypothetical protein HMPREF0986_02457 [Escherichia coli 4_1_47FAA]|nr:hypothetical protein HMPREF0986_02457 [Escherichia coli 4_1_47FAA]
MIPQISQAPGVVQLVLNFLQELEQQGFTGDTATSYADRLTMSTDNSIYQLLPDAVVFPRSTADVALIARLAAQERYSSLIFTPRGGGTGTNGQALNQGIIVDMSRHMNRIIEINPEEGWVRVEAGVIKDQLNQYLKPFGYFFCAGAFDQQPGNARRDDQYRCIRSGIAGLWQNVRSRTWRTRGVVGGRYSRYAIFTRRTGRNAG